MITQESKAAHAHRLIESHADNPEDLRVMATLAARFGYWSHVDWDIVRDSLDTLLNATMA